MENQRLTATDSGQHNWFVDVLFLLVLATLIMGIVHLGRHWTAVSDPLTAAPIDIDLSLWALPGYALLSVMRGFTAYLLSLIFTLVYGSVAAHSRRAEKVMVPLLDILQGIPVLGFMPGFVLGMVALFPHSNFGLELACVLMIFTAQVWNMTFAYYASVRSVPMELREVGRLHAFSRWRIFRVIELPFSLVSLIWNSMMSMAGGWYFLTLNEAFRLENHDFRLPGIGSYMSVAIDRNDTAAKIAAVVMMFFIIIVTDQFLWRPLVVWSQKFRFDDTAGEQERSWVLDLLHQSVLIRKLQTYGNELRRRARMLRDMRPRSRQYPSFAKGETFRTKLPSTIVAMAFFAVLLSATWSLVKILWKLETVTWIEVLSGLGMTFLRTSACVILSALWTVPLGILIGRSPKLSRILQPIVQVLASFPAPMIYPAVTMIFLAFNIPFSFGCIFLMMLGAQWYILFNVIAGSQAIPSDLMETAQVYGMTQFQIWTRIYLPAVFPTLVTGLLTAAGGAWNASIVSEYVRYQNHTLMARGLGSLITRATDQGDFALLAASVLVMSLALVLLNRFFWKKLYHFANTRCALNR